MIFDEIKNASFYYNLHPYIREGLEFLINHDDLMNLAVGKQDIDGDNVFALVQEYQTKEFNEEMWEAHRKYYDLQFVVDGVENIAISHINDISPRTEYNVGDDYRLFKGIGAKIKVTRGQFLLLSPKDVHQPGLIATEPGHVKKIVLKIRIE
ncbi:YhcH/YjgK/YiaL family protein [Anseongella ginsenosidimutans]|uniref:YhcH/YjgK/YiaL family protein n=1 Tax=Anseongella ginsenosidimutans TaxID=496056 RepID=A0A4R3KLS4_9SPHI|nr:YhcH/YjgK/YiaL family protein [Anseongella ginsenosidimutans]QEC52139.1 DUF386 domain-containing protein [Anseongella ginsenosidimutans]TCS84832.1 YhcH/YjgK/YiaL family protein [Anseongella ginsenosidimutans]